MKQTILSMCALPALLVLGACAVQGETVRPIGSAYPSGYQGCGNCGVVESVSMVDQSGQSTGLGAIVGGVAGGVLGHQVGKGRGNDAATVAGAIGGAIVGNEVEKSNKAKTTRYRYNLRMDDGRLVTLDEDYDPGFREGDRIRVIDGRLARR